MANTDLPLGEFRLERYSRLSDEQLQQVMVSIVFEHAKSIPFPMPDFIHYGPSAMWVAKLSLRYFQPGLLADKPQVMVYASGDASAPHDDSDLVMVAIRCPGDQIFDRTFGKLVHTSAAARTLCEMAAMVQAVWHDRLDHSQRNHDERYDRPTVRSTYLLQR